MVQIRRTVVGAAAALALVIGSVATAQVSLAGDADDMARATGGPNCARVPCPPPEDRSRDGAEVAFLAGKAQAGTRAAGVPNRRVPCPPPTNLLVDDVEQPLVGRDMGSGLVANRQPI